MSKHKIYLELNRVEKDKNGKPIPIYRPIRVERSKLQKDIASGKTVIQKVKL